MKTMKFLYGQLPTVLHMLFSCVLRCKQEADGVPELRLGLVLWQGMPESGLEGTAQEGMQEGVEVHLHPCSCGNSSLC